MIGLFLLNLFLAFVYVLLTEDTSVSNIIIGLVIGYIITTLTALTVGKKQYALRIMHLFRFAGYFIHILVKANLQVAWEVITPGYSMHPRIIRYSVRGMTSPQITTFANAITLTPGTLTADIDDAGETLYIHCMYAGKREDAIVELDELRDHLLRDVFDKPLPEEAVA